jgi:TolB-like protein
MLRGAGVTREPPPRVQSIAVLPLESLSQDPEQEYFADGMTEELITTLGKIGALRVTSRTSVMRYKGTKKPLPQIAQELKVDALVEGTVLRSGDRVRITANLLDARTDHHLWAESYERDLRDVMSLQDDVARAIAEAITLNLTPQERASLADASPVNPEAYRLYLEGRYHAAKRTLPGFEKSFLLYQQAIAKDPGYASAYAGLAETYGLLPFYSGAVSKEAFPKAKAAALKALELDNSLAEAHAAMGFVLFYGDWDWPGAERELKSAIELRPSFVISHHWYAEYLSAVGRHDEAIAEIKRAQELDPLSPLLYGIGGEIYTNARRNDEAVEQCRKALDLDPNYALAMQNMAGGYMGKRMYKEAATEYVMADRAYGMNNSSGQALAYAITGKRADALRILRRLQEPANQQELMSILATRLFLALGMEREAVDWLEKAYAEHEAYAPFWNVHPAFDPLRSDPRFQALLRKMNFPK